MHCQSYIATTIHYARIFVINDRYNAVKFNIHKFL